MNWRVITGPEARADYFEIIDYYQQVAPEQVPRFRAEVRKLLKTLADNPHLSMDRGEGVRKRATVVFPYHVWYKVDEATKKVKFVRLSPQSDLGRSQSAPLSSCRRRH